MEWLLREVGEANETHLFPFSSKVFIQGIRKTRALKCVCERKLLIQRYFSDFQRKTSRGFFAHL